MKSYKLTHWIRWSARAHVVERPLPPLPWQRVGGPRYTLAVPNCAAARDNGA